MFGTFLESPEHLMFHISNPLHLILRALQPGVSTIPHGGDKTFEHFRAGLWIERQPTCMAGLIVNRTMQTTTALRTTCKSICKPFANELQHIRTVFRIHDTAGCQSPSLQWHTTCNMHHDMYNAVACELHSQLLCSTLGWHLQVLNH